MDGRFLDSRLGFSAAVSEGWRVDVGEDRSPLRAVFTDLATGARVEVWSYPEDSLQLRPRAGCAWVFEDSGPYEALRVREPLSVARCAPDDPREPTVLGVYLLRDGQAWHIEALYPVGALAPGQARAGELMLGMRFE